MMVGIGLNVKGSAEAVELYKEAFGLSLGYHVWNPDGSYFHSELYRGEQEMLAVVEAPGEYQEENRVQIGVVLDSEAELQKAFDLLSREGRVKAPIAPLPWSPCAAEVIDKFGVWWFLSVPMHKPPEDFDPQAPWEPEP